MLDQSVLHDTAPTVAQLQPEAADKALKVRIMIGAQYAYACITGPAYSLDIRLAPGKSAAASLRDYANEQRAQAERLLRRAERAEAAAARL